MSEHSPGGRSQFAKVRNLSWKIDPSKTGFTISDEKAPDNRAVGRQCAAWEFCLIFERALRFRLGPAFPESLRGNRADQAV